MSNAAIAIIDGTGNWNDDDYRRAMAGSFCRQLESGFVGPTHYERGPSFEGFRIRERGQRAATFLAGVKRSQPDARLFLAGYSRGGSAALFAAHILNEMGSIGVDGLFLFDPVRMHLTSGGRGIPANVHFSRAAVRDLNSAAGQAFVKRQEDTIPLVSPESFPLAMKLHPVIGAAIAIGSVVKADNPVRPGWGNEDVTALDPSARCGIPNEAAGPGAELTTAASGTHYKRAFLGTHGALGGLGWKGIKEDLECQVKVARWMNAGFEEAGLKVTVKSFAP